MDSLSNFLKKFQKIVGDKTEDRRLVQEIIEGACGVHIEPKDIEISGGVVWLSVRPIVRTEVILKKKEILASLNEKGGFFTDLR